MGLEDYLTTNLADLNAVVVNFANQFTAYLADSPAESAEAIQAFVLRSNPGAGGYLDQNGNDIASYIVQNTDTQAFVLKSTPGIGGFLLRSGSGGGGFVVRNPAGGGGFLTRSNPGGGGFVLKKGTGGGGFVLKSGLGGGGFLLKAGAGIGGFILGDADQTANLIATNSQALSTYLVNTLDAATLTSFVNSLPDPLAAVAYEGGAADGLADLQNYLAVNTADLTALVNFAPDAVTSFFSASPTSIASFVLKAGTGGGGFTLKNGTGGGGFELYVQQNLDALGTQYIAGDPINIAAYLNFQAPVSPGIRRPARFTEAYNVSRNSWPTPTTASAIPAPPRPTAQRPARARSLPRQRFERPRGVPGGQQFGPHVVSRDPVDRDPLGLQQQREPDRPDRLPASQRRRAHGRSDLAPRTPRCSPDTSPPSAGANLPPTRATARPGSPPISPATPRTFSSSSPILRPRTWRP